MTWWPRTCSDLDFPQIRCGRKEMSKKTLFRISEKLTKSLRSPELLNQHNVYRRPLYAPHETDPATSAWWHFSESKSYTYQMGDFNK